MMGVSIKTPAEIEKMRAAGAAAASVLEMLVPHVKAGVTTDELNTLCHDYIENELGCVPAPLNYRGFPKSVCTSINHQVCHGIPNERALKKGDIVNVDVTVIKDGYHGDTSRMFMLEPVSVQARRLVDVCRTALFDAIAQVAPGRTLGDLGHVIQTLANQYRYGVVREYCGHGIGSKFHEEPQVLHYGSPNTGLELQAGMTFTIEPMLNAGRHEVRLLPDEWTVVTKDHSLSAQWEHTILVTPTGCEILTLRAEELTGELPGCDMAVVKRCAGPK